MQIFNKKIRLFCSIVLVIIIVFSILCVESATIFAVTTEKITYSFNVKSGTVCAFEGITSFPGDKLKVNSVKFADNREVYYSMKDSTILFNVSESENSFDFSEEKALITVEFSVIDTFNYESIWTSISNFYTNEQYLTNENTPFRYSNIINGIVISSGYVNIDNDEEGFTSPYEPTEESQEVVSTNTTESTSLAGATESIETTKETTDPTSIPTQSTTENTQPTTEKIEKKDISNWDVFGVFDQTYTGGRITQDIIFVFNGKEYATFDTTYKNNINAGKATVILKGTGRYTGTITKTFKINKAKQPMTAKASAKSVKASKLKKARVTVKKAITVKKNQGAVTYKKVSGSKYLKITRKGVVTVKKGKYKKQTLKIKVTVTAKGTSNYRSGSKTVTVKVKIK